VLNLALFLTLKTKYVSHQPERFEKNCLNCGTEVAGRFCQHCGQENVVIHMRFFALVRHFIYDIFHFDGKFFDTLKYLLFKPGYVAKQYVDGKRLSYLDPIKMYLFTSAVFFLFFFAFASIDTNTNLIGTTELSKAQRFDHAAKHFARGTAAADTSGAQALQVLLDTNYTIIASSKENDFTTNDSLFPVRWKDDGKLFSARKVSGEKSIVLDSKSKWLEKGLNARWQRYKKKFDGSTNAVLRDFLDKLVHRFPYLLFLSLPFFAAILKVLYVRKKHLLYFDHAVFTLYHYVFSFILLLLIVGSVSLGNKIKWDIFSYITNILVLSWPLHLLFAMKRFYLQGWGRTIIKFVLLNGLGLMVLSLLFFLFLLYSIYSI
jgi:hypothetical protein